MQFVDKSVALIKRMIVTIARNCGIDLFILKENYIYVPDIYGKNHFKMFDIRDDDLFRNTADIVINDKKTLLYYDRLHVIFQSIINVRNRFSGNYESMNFVEVGVYKGGGSFFIASILQKLFKENFNLYCIDTFEGHSKEDLKNAKNDIHCPSWFSDTSYEAVSSYLSGFNFVKIFKGRIQEYENLFFGKTIHFVHLDVDLYLPMLFSLNLFSSVLKQGGIILVDDFGFKTCPGVRKAVDEFMRENEKIFLKFGLPTGQCLLVKLV